MYAAQLDGQRLTFEVYGVWRRNMLMRDHETGTIWQHATGEAVAGRLQGRSLDWLSSQEITWGALRAQSPQAQFILPPERHSGLIPLVILERMLSLVTPRASLPGLAGVDRRLDAHTVVIGVVVNGEAMAYPLSVLQPGQDLHTTLGGQVLKIECQAGSGRVLVRAANGQVVPHQRQWWLGWSEFHPRSGVYSPSSSSSR